MPNFEIPAAGFEEMPPRAIPVPVMPPTQPGRVGLVEKIRQQTELEQTKLQAELDAGDEVLLAMDYNMDRKAILMWRGRAERKAATFAGRAATQAVRAERRQGQDGIASRALGIVHRGLARYFGWRQRNNAWSVSFYDRQLAELEASREAVQ